MQEGYTIIGAGLENVDHTLRIFTYWIYSTPVILSKLRAELAPDRDASHLESWNLKRLEQLPYLTAVIMEGIRFNPGNVTGQARIAADRELVYDTWSMLLEHQLA